MSPVDLLSSDISLRDAESKLLGIGGIHSVDLATRVDQSLDVVNRVDQLTLYN